MQKLALRLLLLLMVMVSGNVFAYAEGLTPKKGVIRVKLQPEVALQVGATPKVHTSGVLKTGVTPLDVSTKAIKALSIRRVFPYAPKFEAQRAKYGLDRWYEITFDESVSTAEAISTLKKTAGVQNAHGIVPMELKENATFRKVTSMPKAATTAMPFNDPRLSAQWHYHNDGSLAQSKAGADINLFEAWKTTTGSDKVTVAIIDGGIDLKHEDLAGNIALNEAELNGTEGVDDDGNGYIDDIYGWNFCTNSATIYPHDHGTHVAGTVAAVNNNGIGVAGVAGGDGTSGSGVKMISVQVFDSRSGTGAADFAAAIVYAAERGATIAQCSWGWASADYVEQSVLDAIDYFTESARSENMTGGLCIFATGNNGETGNWYPGCYEPVLAVAAMSDDLTPSYYSNYGEWVDVVAPGGLMDFGDIHGVLSTLPDDSYGYSEGTSMATPHVSGIAALILSKHGKTTLTNEALRQQIVTSVNDFYTLNPSAVGKFGSGYVDAAKALVMGDGTAPEAVAEFTANPAQDNITIEWIIPASSDNNVNNHILYYSTTAFDATTDLSSVSSVVIDTKFYASGDKATYELTGLKSLTTYYLALKAVDRWGNASALSPVVEVKTNEGPKMTVDKTSLTLKQTPAALVGTATFTIGNDAEGLLKWNGLKRTTSSSIKAYSRTKALLANVVPFTGTLGAEKAVTHSVVKTDEFEQADYPKEFKYFNELYASIGESDKTLPNSAAQWFYVDPNVYADGFNLTAVKMKSTYGQNPTVQIYKGSTITSANLVQEIVPSYFYSDMVVKLTEQLYFAPGESFWVVFHFPAEGNQDNYPLGMGDLTDDTYASYSYMSNDMGKTWVTLANALKGSNYESMASSMGWTITAMSQNPDWSTLLTLTPSEGTVKKGETQEVTLSNDGQPLCNGTYKFNISFNTNESEANTTTIPVTFTVSGHAPKMKASKVVDFGALLVGQEKTLTVEVYNEGYGPFGYYGSLSGNKISCTSEHFKAPTYIQGGFPARSANTFEVTFAPQASGSHTGTIVFKNADGTEFKVYLHGVATDPAKIAVEPAIVEVGDLEVGGASVTKEFTIKNEGSYPLEYVFPKFSDETIEGVKGKVHKFGYTVASNLNGATDFAYNANTELIGATDITSTYSDNVYLSKEIYLGFAFPFYGKTYERAYITSYGGIAFGTGEYAYRSPLAESAYGLEGVPYISAYGTQLTFGPNSKIEYAKQDGKFVVKFTDVLGLVYDQEYTPISFRIVLSANGDVEIFYDSYDPMSMNLFQGGSTLYCGILDAESEDPMTVTSADIADYWGNNPGDPAGYVFNQFTNQSAVKFIAPKPNMVTSLSAPYGMVGPGETATITATLAADETMNAGETFNNLVLMSNDLTNGTTLVKFTANITGANLLPAVALESNEIDFGKVFRTSDTKVAVTVKNTGKAVMNVTDIKVANNVVSFEATLPFAIEPGMSKDIIVTIPTATSGTVADVITVTTDAGEVVANIKGEVIGVPVVELSLNEITETVKSGTPVEKDLVITNNGDEDLVYSIKPNNMVEFEDTADETSTVSYQYATSVDDSSVKYEWVDIETNGKGDQYNFSYYNMHDYVAVELPFEFPFYGKKYSKMYIYNTGFISFTERDDQKMWPEPPATFPSGTIYTNVIAPYWGLHTMDITKTAGTYHYVTEDEAVVSFMEYGNSMNMGVCYQVIMKKDGSFKFQYKGYGDYAIIYNIFGLAGISNEDGSEGIQLPERYVQFGNAVEFAPIVESTIAPKANKTIKLSVDTDKMAGTYNTELEMSTNVPSKEKLVIPVNMTITGEAKPVFPTDTIVIERIMSSMDGYREDLPAGGVSGMGAYYEAAFKVENQGTAPFTITNVKNGGPSVYDDWFGSYNPVFYTYYYAPELDWWTGEPTGNYAWTSYYDYTPVEVDKDGAWFSIPMIDNMLNAPHTPGTYDVPLTFYYNESDSAVVNVRFVVTSAPYAVLDKEEIRVEGVAADYKGVETVTLSNMGQYKLTYELVMDPTGKGEEADENNAGGGVAPMAKSVAAKILSVEKMAALKANICDVKPLAEETEETTVSILDAPQDMEYNNVLYYPTVANSTTPSYGAGNTYTTYKAATYYEAPAEGFNISHIYLATTLTNADGSYITNADIKVEIVNGEDYENGDVLAKGSVHIESMEGARFMVIPLDNAVFMNPGQGFYVRVTYPIGVEYPAYLTYKEEAVVSNRFMGYVEGYGWFDVASMFKDTYGSLGYIMTCIETAPGQPWVKLLSAETGTLAAPADGTENGSEIGGGGAVVGPLSTEASTSVELQVQVDAASAPLIRGNKAVLVIKSNDPTQPIINFPIYLDKNASPVVTGPETLVYAKENATTTVNVVASDPDGDDFTILFSDPAELATLKSVTAVNPNEAATIVISEDKLSATVSGVTEGVNVEVEIAAKYGDAGKYTFTVTAVDAVKAEGQAIVSYEVEHVNQAPVANDINKIFLAIGSVTELITYDGLFTDPDGEDMTYELTIPENNSLTKFMSSNEGFVLRGKASGTVTVTVVATDESGASSAIAIDVVVYDPASGIDVNSLNAKVEVYPNPVAETLYVTCDFSAKKTTYVLYAANGSKVYDSTEDSKQGESKSINVAALAEGVYILQVATEDGSATFHVVKK